MKKILLFNFIIFSCLLHSQVTLTQTFNEPKPGDLESTYQLDTSAFSSGLPINVTGNNVVWNFTNLVATQPVLDNYYLSAASVTSSANYPGCTFVQESNNLTTYFKSTTTPTTQTELLGLKSNTISVTFTNSAIIVKYPFSYGSSVSDNLSGAFTASITGTCNGTINTLADGQGTLNLPGMTLANVLRIKSVQTLTLTAGFFGEVGVLKHTVYNYYHSIQQFPVLSISYDYLSTAFSSTPSVTGLVTGSTNYFVTGIKENTLNSADVNLYPNPAQNSLIIDLDASLHGLEIKLYNALGQLILSTSYTNAINLSGLTNGIYTAEIITEQGTIRKKIIKE